MFILQTTEFPQSPEQLASALNDSLRRWVQRPGAAMASVNGELPRLSSITIDLSGGVLDIGRPPPDVQPATTPQPGPSATRFKMIGQPLHTRGVAVAFDLSAVDVTFSYARNAAGQPVVLLQEARDGKLRAAISLHDLESALLQAARTAATPSGISVQRVEASLSTPTPKQLDVELMITAKKFVTAEVRIRARATLDDQLNATLSNLSAHADSMVGRLAVGLVQGYLQKLEGQQFSLMAFSLGSVRLRDVSVQADDGLKVAAEFGT